MSRIGEPALWFIFGEYPDGAHVDVSDGQRDVLVRVTRAEAAEAIATQYAVWCTWCAEKNPQESTPDTLRAGAPALD